MTFEQHLKNILRADLDNIFGLDTEHKMRITVANDVSDGSLDYRNSLLALIHTGQGTRLAVPDYNLVSLPLFITFYFDRNFTQRFLNEINTYIENLNAKTIETVIDQVPTFYKIVYDSPIVSQGSLDWSVKNDKMTIKIAQISLMAQVTVSTQDAVKRSTFEFVHNGVNYPIKNYITYNMNTTPSFDSSVEINETFSKKDTITYETTIEITVLKQNNDAFSNLITNHFRGSPIDMTLPMFLHIDNKSQTIQSVSITEIRENGKSYFVVTFTR